MRLIAKMYGHVIDVGTVVELPFGENEDQKFEVLQVNRKSYKIRWLNGAQENLVDHLPYTLFGDEVITEEISEGSRDPNTAFLYKRLSE
jgi:hypothetical protein